MPVSLQGYAESTYFDLGNIFTHTKLAVDPVTQTFYAAQAGQSTLRQLTRDKTLSTVSTNVTGDNLFPFLGTDIQFYEGSVYMSVSNGKLIRFDASSGTSTELTTIAGFNYEAGLDVFDGKLYIADGSGTANQIQSYDVATGALTTVLSNIPAETYSVEIHPVSGHLYFSEKTTTQIKFYVADRVNQTSRLIGSVNSAAFGDFAVDPSEQFLYFRNSVTVDQIAIADGMVNTFMTGLESFDFQDLTFAPASAGNRSSLYVLSGGKLLEVTSSGNDFNYAPAIEGTALSSVTANSTYRFQPQVSDLDQDTLTFSIDNQPSWATFNAETGELNGTPMAENIGTTNGIEISVSDGRVTTKLPGFNLTVNAAVDPASTPSLISEPTPTSTPIANSTPIITDLTRMTIAGDTLAVMPPSINFRGGKKGIEANGETKSSLLSGNDLIIGDAAKNQLSGMAGNDRIFGKQGNDRISGGAGNDQMDGGQGNDVVNGGSGDDVVKGGAGNDRLVGGDGADILVGGSGMDVLTGGAGTDVFVLTVEQQHRDIITDFQVREDLLDLRLVFAATRSSDISPMNWFRQSIRLEQMGASTIVKLDRDGSGAMLSPLVTLNNVNSTTIEARNFVVS
jgi:hypothetical protein